MKRNPITLITGGLLLVIFVLMLFSFQVRTTEVAVVTRFGRAVETKSAPGWYVRAPWPINKIYKFDNRIQNFETKYEQTSTKDAINVLVAVYAGWKVADAKVFLESFNSFLNWTLFKDAARFIFDKLFNLNFNEILNSLENLSFLKSWTRLWPQIWTCWQCGVFWW